MTLQEAVDRYVQQAVEHELDFHWRTKGQDKFDELMRKFPNAVAVFRVEQKLFAAKLADTILDKAECWTQHYRKGRFHPSNKLSRQMFLDLTGITLNSSVGETDQQIRSYVGQATIDAAQAVLEAKEAARLAYRQAKRDLIIHGIRQRVLQNDTICGDELLQLARSLGVEVHPRTAGTLRRRVAAIQDGQARIRGRELPQAVWDVYSECRRRIKAETEVACGQQD